VVSLTGAVLNNAIDLSGDRILYRTWIYWKLRKVKAKIGINEDF
jgi:hypothetical protein